MGILSIFALLAPYAVAINVPPSSAFGVGVVVGLMAFIDLPISLLSWSIVLVLGPWLIAGLIHGLLFLLVNIAVGRSPGFFSFLALPSIWVLMSTLSELMGIAPMDISVSLVSDYARSLWIARFIGAAGLDFLILSATALTYHIVLV